MMDDQINVHIFISLGAVTLPEVSGLFPYGMSIWSAQIKTSYMSTLQTTLGIRRALCALITPQNHNGNQKSFMC